MVVPRASILSRGLGRSVLHRAKPAARSQGWRQVGRRSYASGHGEQQSSELPWIIGSLAFTVPAAGWLLQQGPTKSDHGHDAHGNDHESDGEEKQETENQEGGEQDGDDSNSDGESKDETPETDEGKDEKQDSEDKEDKDKTEESQDEGKDDYPPPSPGSPGQINWKPGMGKGPGEGQKGERKPSERKGEKDSQGSHSGAKHPHIDDPEKSKKGQGVTETAKIHGTVDSRQSARGPNTDKGE